MGRNRYSLKIAKVSENDFCVYFPDECGCRTILRGWENHQENMLTIVLAES